MNWSPLPKGEFTGIDWGLAGAADGYDPYLAWAEASRFAGYQRKVPAWLPLLVELAPGCSIAEFAPARFQDWLRVPPGYAAQAELAPLRFCTAWVGKRFFTELGAGGALAGKVLRFELGLPVGHHTDPPPMGRGAAVGPGELLRGHVFGLIDGGLAFANQAFLQRGVTTSAGKPMGAMRARTRFFWRQDDEGVGEPPAAMGYGHELRGEAIEQAIGRHTHGGLVDEAAIYSGFGLPDLRKPANHGTHVADLACGPRDVMARVANAPPGFDAPPSWAAAGDDASRCDLVAVQLDWCNVIDTSGGSMNVSIMDALVYIFSRCAPQARLVINISWGTLAGPHNGTSVLEAAIDQLVRLRPGQTQIVLPAGNGYQDRLHANATLAPGQSLPLHWKVLPDDATQSFLELWFPPDAKDLRISVGPPGGHAALQGLRVGESRMWRDAQGRAIAALIYPARVATGRDGTCALLALAPTFSFSADAATSPCGVWQVEVSNRGPAPVTVDAYVERDDVALGQSTGARQSHFEGRRYDTSGNPASYFDQPVAAGHQLEATLIRRSGTFNSLATGHRTVSVGSKRLVGQGWSEWALYSPRQDDPDAARPQRPGVVRAPSRMALGDENPVLLGLSAAGTFSGSVARLVGTSGSAPLVARQLFNDLGATPATSAPAASS